MAHQTNSFRRNHVYPIAIGLLTGLAAAYLAPEIQKARRAHPAKPVASNSLTSIHDSSWRLVVLPIGGMVCVWSSYMIGVVFFNKRLATALERRDISKGEGGAALILAMLVATPVFAVIYDCNFSWELERLLRPYHGNVGTYEYHPELMWLHFRTGRNQDRNLPEIDDRDLPAIVEIALRAVRQQHWTSIGLDLSHTNVTDNSLSCLERLPDKFSVTLDDTSVTGEGVELLRRKKPNLHVNFSDH